MRFEAELAIIEWQLAHMTTLSFLAALPALLAIVGFVVYQLLHRQGEAQQITHNIVAKLRRESPAQAATVLGLGPRQLAARLKAEVTLRRAVDEQDYQLLTRVIHQEFVKSLVVYSLIAVCFVIGVSASVYVQTRSRPEVAVPPLDAKVTLQGGPYFVSALITQLTATTGGITIHPALEQHVRERRVTLADTKEVALKVVLDQIFGQIGVPVEYRTENGSIVVARKGDK